MIGSLNQLAFCIAAHKRCSRGRVISQLNYDSSARRTTDRSFNLGLQNLARTCSRYSPFRPEGPFSGVGSSSSSCSGGSVCNWQIMHQHARQPPYSAAFAAGADELDTDEQMWPLETRHSRTTEHLQAWFVGRPPQHAGGCVQCSRYRLASQHLRGVANLAAAVCDRAERHGQQHGEPMPVPHCSLQIQMGERPHPVQIGSVFDKRVRSTHARVSAHVQRSEICNRGSSAHIAALWWPSSTMLPRTTGNHCIGASRRIGLLCRAKRHCPVICGLVPAVHL